MNELLKIGDKAPDFTALNHLEEKVSLSSFKGKKVILYFYPKDDTPGCTKEACDFRDHFAEWKKDGFEIVGVSIDSVSSHQKFIKKYQLPFTLIADQSKQIVKLYGVWVEKNMYGRKYMGIHRSTFLIDEKGIISLIVKQVKSGIATKQLKEKLGLL